VNSFTLKQAPFVQTYPADGSVTNFRKADAEPTATIEPHESWRPRGDHGLGDQSRKAHH
jgi:hypothetical protein